MSTVDILSAQLELHSDTLEVLVHPSLKLGPNHAYGIAQFLKRQSAQEIIVDLGIVERKGWVRHVERSLRYVYTPVVPGSSAADCAFQTLIRRLFDSSSYRAIKAIITSNMF